VISKTFRQRPHHPSLQQQWTLRRATFADHDPVQYVQSQAYAANRGILGVEPLPLSVDYRHIFQAYDVWVAESDDAILGVLILELEPKALLIWSIAVTPAAQGRGLGRSLLMHAELEARRFGRRCIRLYTGEKLTANIAWYIRCGYAFLNKEQLPDRNIVHLGKILDRSELEDAVTKRLEGKRTLLTAAAAGIGRATAEAFVAEGAHVIATDVDISKLHGLAGSDVHKLDVRSGEAINTLARAVGPIDVLFNCAGFVHHGTILECSDDDWAFSFDLNVTSMHRMIQAFLPGMLHNNRGSIINIASGASSVRGIPNRYVYGATKAAVIGLTKAVAADFIKNGIRCNAICPGTIESPSLDSRIAALAQATSNSVESVRQSFIDRQPMGRLGKPQEIAMLAVYLASDESTYTTGQVHLADGGFAL
jgi:2-keto-3-deoxy-L-fuconate dehydrogenase